MGMFNFRADEDTTAVRWNPIDLEGLPATVPEALASRADQKDDAFVIGRDFSTDLRGSRAA
jgi:hypothetical protein